MSSPFAVLGLVLTALIGIAVLTHEEDDKPRPAAPFGVIAKRVEALRGARFDRAPVPLTVSPAQAQEEGLADLDRGYPAAERAADEALYATLGLIPKATDLRQVSASLFGEQVAGYYDPRTGRLRVVEGTGGNRVIDEITLAHELTHALEDQAFTLDTDVAEESGDAGYAYRALVEGTATAVMLEYAGRHFGAEEALGGLLASAFQVTSTTPLPPFVQAGFTWPYIGGQTFVQELFARAGRSWRLVDVALQARPPTSTEQVLHPEKWLAVEEPDTVRLAGVGRALGAGWTRATDGVFGEWQTGELLALGGRRQPEAAAGWGGDRYELWQRGKQSVVAMRWRWDSPKDAQEFGEAIVAALPEVGSPARYSVQGRDVSLVVAPDTATSQAVLDALTA